MKLTNWKSAWAGVAMLVVATSGVPQAAQAHCDGLDGPVVQAAQRALGAAHGHPGESGETDAPQTGRHEKQ